MNYKITREIARGGFGRVYEVVDDKGAKFAMKILEPAASMVNVPIEQLKKRFEREVKYQSALSHPNIAKIH